MKAAATEQQREPISNLDRISGELSLRAQAGDADALTELCRLHQGLIWTIVERYRRKGARDVRDLRSEGMVGLIRAVQTYDPQAAAFSTYAYVVIRSQVFPAAMNCSCVRVSMHKSRKRLPSKSLLRNRARAYRAMATGTSGMTWDYANPWQGEYVRFDDMEGREPDPAIAVSESDAETQQLDGLLSVLSLRERDIIELRFGIGRTDESTLQGIADAHGVSKERIRQIEIRALGKMQNKAGRLGFATGGPRENKRPDLANWEVLLARREASIAKLLKYLAATAIPTLKDAAAATGRTTGWVAQQREWRDRRWRRFAS